VSAGLDGREAALTRLVLGATLALGLLKLWLAHGDEIIAVHNPWDQLRYAEMARELRAGRWLGPYNQATLIRSPAYPAWVALVGAFGVPLRIAVELLLVTAGVALAMVAQRSGARPWAAVAAAGFVIFVPFSFFINSQMLSESFTGPLTVLSIAAAAAPWVARSARGRWLGIALWSLTLVTLWHTRPERLLVLTSVAAAVAVDLLWIPSGTRRPLRALAERVAAPLAFILVSMLALRGANKVAYGAFVEQELVSSSFADALEALLRIENPEPRRFVGLPEKARRLAYAVSPSFRRLEPLLEGEVKGQWTISSCTHLSLCDDYANGWSHLALREAAALSGVHRDAPTAEAFYAAMAEEIHGACRTGALPCRAGWLPYVEPPLLALLPESFRIVATRVVFPPTGVEPLSERLPVPAAVAQTYDDVALRRTALPAWGGIVVAGWAFGENGASVRDVRVHNSVGHVLVGAQPLLHRDISSHFPMAPPFTGFDFTVRKQQPEPELPGARLVFTLSDGRAVSVPLQQGGGVVSHVRFSVDIAREDALPPDPTHRLRSWLARAYPYALLGSLLAAALGLAYCLFRPQRGLRWRGEPLGALIWLCAITVVIRVLYFSAVDVFLIPVSMRFIYPVIGLTGVTAILVLSALAARARYVGPDAR
jgi:hypothetical protein